MKLRIENPGPTVQQVSGNDPEGRFILSVLVKQTYIVSERGECVEAPVQAPLSEDIKFDPDDSNLLVEDTDLFPYKPRSDVIVKGHAYGYRSLRQYDVEVRIGQTTKAVAVFGDRRCTRTASGGLVFSSPEPAEKIPLTYARAYGGRDKVAETAALKKFMEYMPLEATEMGLTGNASPYLYPRNPCGRGYLMEPASVGEQGVELPNLEDPADVLTPTRIAVRSPLMWPQMPLPQATDWCGYGLFPRISGVGLLPPFDRNALPFPEAVRGFVPEAVLNPGTLEAADAFHLACGASLGLQLPYLKGNEDVSLKNIHPKQPEFSFRLPGQIPRIWTDGRNGKLNTTTPVIHTVVIEPDESRVSILWRGSAVALRPYLEEELKTMPLRVEWE